MTTELVIDTDAIVANWRALDAMHAGETAAVVKADAYGLGAARVAPALAAAGVRTFFVGHPSEGAALRPLLPGATIGVLNGLWPDSLTYLNHDLAPSLSTLPEIHAWGAAAEAAGRTLPAFLHVDTGMNRLGLSADDLARLGDEPGLLDFITVHALLTHLAGAEDEADPGNAAQQVAYEAARGPLARLPTSIANSSGVFLGGPFGSDLARPGAALYGLNPRPGAPNPMRPVLRLRARVLQIRTISAGAAVGYNGTWAAARPTRVATVSVGYADGYPRSLSNRGAAAFDGAIVPLIGRVSMDLTTFDVTDHPTVVVGSWLEMIGPAMPPEAVAERAGTNGYEILTSLGRRYARRYGPL